MGRGLIYTTDFVRMTERERALKAVEKIHKSFEEKMELVKQGKLKLIKTPISKGFTIKFVPTNEESN